MLKIVWNIVPFKHCIDLPKFVIRILDKSIIAAVPFCSQKNSVNSDL